MGSLPLSEMELQRLRDLVIQRIEEVESELQPTSFLDNLITKTLRRYPARPAVIAANKADLAGAGESGRRVDLLRQATLD